MPDAQGHETDDERLDRELDQLLQELCVAMPGVQVLWFVLGSVRRMSDDASRHEEPSR